MNNSVEPASIRGKSPLVFGSLDTRQEALPSCEASRTGQSVPAPFPACYLHPSNAVTYLAILSALLAVAVSAESSHPSLAGLFLTLACLADALDGVWARQFRRGADQVEFGKQLDSLADAMVFGAAPVMAGYLLLQFDSFGERFLWTGAALFYLICVATRLGCFNLHQSGGDAFIGLPTTVAGLFWSAHWLARPEWSGTVLVLVLCAAALVSPLRVPRGGVTGRVLFLGCALILLFLHAWILAGSAKVHTY